MFEAGSQLGRYEVQRRLGRGGMGTVYVAHDPILGRMVAIKVFAGDLDVPDARERFTREARAAAALHVTPGIRCDPERAESTVLLHQPATTC